MSDADSKGRVLRELALLFLKLGTTAFGGPAGHLAMMEEEVVRRRGWLTHTEFLDLLGASNLIPGPTSTEMAIHIGYQRGGFKGLIVAGSCFILPAALLVAVVAWVYVRWGQLPQAGAIFYGIKPVVIGILVDAMWRLTRAAVKTRFLGLVAVVAAVLNFVGVNELLVLFASALFVVMVRWVNRRRIGNGSVAALLPVTAGWPLAQSAAVAVPVGLWPLFLVFLKVGAVLFGGGYVLVAFLRADLVDRYHWMSESQLLDAVAVGQFTPGPLFTTATFVGYVLLGGWGALVATMGIFLPAFVFVAISGPFIVRMRASPTAGAFLDGLNVASLALLAVVSWQLARAAVVDVPTVLLAGLSLAILVRFRVNSAWLVMGGALVGFILSKWH